SMYEIAASTTAGLSPLPLHDALPISGARRSRPRGRRVDQRDEEHDGPPPRRGGRARGGAHGARGGDRGDPADDQPRRSRGRGGGDRKSTRLNSSHVKISYAVFCLKKK